MTCKNCGIELVEGIRVCPNCGTQTESVLSSLENILQTPDQTISKFSVKAIVGFVLSLVGMIVAAIPCGIIGVIFSSLGLKDTQLPQYKGGGLAIAGLVVSIVDIILGIIIILSM